MATKKKKKQELISDDAFMALNTANLRPIQETYEETATRHKQEKAKKKQESTFSAFNDGYDFGDVTRTILKGGKKLGQATVGAFKKPSYFDDGYDFGDITKTTFSTVKDLGVSATKGFMKASESISDWGYNKLGDIEWALGFEDRAMQNWQTAMEDSTSSMAQSSKHILAGDLGGELSNKTVNQAYQEMYEKNKKGSLISRKGEEYVEEIARMATIAGYGSLTGGQAGTDLLFYASAASNAENEARMAGATPEEAWRYSILSGTAEMLTEKMFGGLGKISDHLGVSKGVAEQFTNKLTNKITNTFFKNLAEYGISATGEGFEEVASGFLDAYAKKLTYMKDADIKQLLADQDLMEQFVQGTVTSFFMQAPNFVQSNVAKVDYKTGYTKNEQQVVDKLIQERVDEASKDGKVSGKKYAEIRDKVNEDLKNGDIKVRDIERLLGGETYTNYQNALNEDNKINKRLDELNQKIDEYENLSASEKLSRANEYKKWETELESITEEKNRSIENTSNLQRQLSSEVYNLAGKDSNFARSYQDEAQKSVAFNKNQYDYDNLSDNKKALLDSAVNANANNTKAIHKLTQGIMDMMNAEDSFKYEFVNDDMLRESGLSDQTKYKVTSRDTLESIANKNNMTVEQLKKLNNNISSVKAGQELNVYSKNITNGLVIKKDNKILINLDAVNRLETVVGHEMTHLIEKVARGKATGEYGDYRKSLFEYAEKKGDLEKIRKEFERLYKDQNLTQEELDQEITAELSGRYLFSDEKFLKLVAEDRANTKIRDFIDDLVVKFTGTEEEKQLRELQKKYRDAYQNRNRTYKEATKKEKTNKTVKETVQKETIAPVAVNEQLKETPKSFNEVVDEDLFNVDIKEVENQFNKEKYNLNEDVENDEGPVGNYWDLDDYNFKLKDGNTLWVETPTEYGKYKNGNTNYQDEIHNQVDFFIEDSDGNILDEYSIKNEKGEFTRDDILNAIKHLTYDDSNKVADGQLDIFDNVHRNNGVQYSIAEDKNHGTYWDVETNKDIFKNITNVKTIQKKALDFIKKGNKNFDIQDILNDNSTIRFINKLSGEYVYGSNSQTLNQEQLKNKMRIAPSVDDLINNAPIKYKSPYYEHGSKNSLLFKKNGYDNFQGLVGIDGNLFSYIVKIGIAPDNNSLFYDVSLKYLDKIKRANTMTYSSDGASSIKNVSALFNNDNISQNNDNVKRSLSDNQGRELTPEQQEYFKDSKIRDDDGKLKTMYHGTPYGGFTVFNNSHNGSIGDAGYFGYGYYFTDDQRAAYEYSDADFIAEDERTTTPGEFGNVEVKEVYLDVKNPFIVDGSKVEYEMGSLEKLLGTESPYDSTELLKEQGYDGVIYQDGGYSEVTVFEPSQIKNVDNTNPTSNPDIRYSLSSSGEMVDNSTGEKVTLEVADIGTTGNLMVLHNMGENKLNGILDLDGIPVPSLAITDVEKVNFDQYGGATAIFDKKTIDPSNYKNEVYDRDVWSPTQPRVDYEINEKNIDRIAEEIGVEDYTLKDYAEDRNGAEDLARTLADRDSVVEKFVKDNNIKYETAYKEKSMNQAINNSKVLQEFIKKNDITFEKLVRNEELRNQYISLAEWYIDKNMMFERQKQEARYFLQDLDNAQNGLRPYFDEDFENIKNGKTSNIIDEYQTERNMKEAARENGLEEYLKNKVKDVYGEKGIYNGKEYVTETGRRTFWQLHNKYTLNNLVKELTKGNTKGTQETLGTGIGQIQASMGNQFNSIEEIQNARENIKANADELTQELRNKTTDDIGTLADYVDSWSSYDIVSELLIDVANSGDLSIDNVRKIIRQDYDPDLNNATDTEIQNVLDDLEQWRNIPTDYFEAKPQRAVGLNEIQQLLIPQNFSEETKQRVRDKGIPYIEYDSTIPGERQRLEKQFEDLKFSLSQQNDIAPIGEGTYSQDVKLQETQMDRIENQLNELSNTLERINNNIPRETNVDVDGFDLNLEPFMDMINNSVQTEADMRNVTQTRQNIENNLKLINDNFDRIKGTLVEQGLPVDAAQDFIENVVNKYDRQYRETLENSGKNNKIEKMLLDAQEKFTNRNAWIDKLSKDFGNENIKLLGDMANNSFQEASTNINRFQTDLNGKKIGKGIKDIFEPYSKEGLSAVAEDYLFNRSNIERHKVGKGSTVPVEVSQQLVKDYLAQYPQLKNLTEDIQNYYDNLLTQEVKSGLIDQDTYNLLRGEKGIYRSYVPFYPSDAEKRYFDNQGNLKPAQTLKRAKGGASKIMGIEEAMGKQTMAVWNSIRTNQLYQEIINTIGGEEGFGAIIRNEPSNLDQSLYTDTDGNRFLTAFVDGREMTAQISEDLYNELSRNGENRIKALEERYSAITKTLQGLSKLRRNILTSYNPTFALFKNPIKDIQDAVLYSRHTTDMLKNLPSAYKELWTGNTETVQQFLALYGSNEYQGIGKGYAKVSEMIELAPRYAEFKASLQNGDSVAKAIYNARDITTNFGRGGYVTKALNRNGFTFLNASVQGFSKLVRNFTEQPNARQFTMAVGKAALLGIVPAVFNELAFGGGDDKDEDYEALPDYIKDNYYIFKLGDNADYDDGTGAVISVGGSKFLRIPKGRALSIFGSAARRTIELAEGDENAFEGYWKNAWTQVGPVEIAANPLDNTIFAPIAQVAGGEKTSGGNTTGRAWYGGDIVPTRLQGERPEDQYDASVDKFSIWLGQKTGWSPYKINYVLDQYSGGIGDVVLPMLTEETKNGAETPLDYLIAPVRDQLVVNSIDDNKYASEFYSTKEKLYKGSKATDEEKLRAQYMDDVSWDLSSLYKEKRVVQSDNSLSKKEKYAKVQAIQAQINDIARAGLNMSKTIDVSGSYASVSDDRAYYKNAKGQWTAIPQEDLTTVESLGMTDAEKSNYFDASNALYNIYNKYKEKKEGKSETEQIELNIKQKKERLDTIKNSPLSDNAKYALFDKNYDDKLLSYYEDLGFKANDVLTYKSQTFTADKDKKGKTINNSKKKKVVNYINSMNIPTIQKKILYKKEYKADKSYDREIFNYINNSDMDYSSKKAVLKELGINAR